MILVIIGNIIFIIMIHISSHFLPGHKVQHNKQKRYLKSKQYCKVGYSKNE